jgi:hypothetical protein
MHTLSPCVTTRIPDAEEVAAWHRFMTVWATGDFEGAVEIAMRDAYERACADYDAANPPPDEPSK